MLFYHLTQSACPNETLTDQQFEENHITYGIALQVDGHPADKIADISTNKNEVQALIDLLNKTDLAQIHFRNVVEDFCQNNYRF